MEKARKYSQLGDQNGLPIHLTVWSSGYCQGTYTPRSVSMLCCHEELKLIITELHARSRRVNGISAAILRCLNEACFSVMTDCIM
jgi:hypothetical protein